MQQIMFSLQKGILNYTADNAFFEQGIMIDAARNSE